MDAKQLEKMMGFAPGELEKAAEAYEKDEWPKGHYQVGKAADLR